MKRTAICFATLALLSTAASAEQWRVRTLVPGSAFHGVHGLAVDAGGRLLAGSVVGQAIYEVAKGKAKTLVPPPQGMADDIAIAPDGTMAWTAYLIGDVYSKKGDGPIRKLASGLPGINSLAYRADGRLYATQVFLGDALYEIDTNGVQAPRKIMENMGGLNGFEIGKDGKLYGPLWFKGQIVRVDLDAAKIDVLAEGLKVPAAVNLNSKGEIFAIDTKAGELVRIDPATRQKKVVAKLKTGLDNLAIDRNDRIFVSNMVDNSIEEVNPKTGRARTLISGKLAIPGGLAITIVDGRDTLHVADVFAYRQVDGASGRVKTIARMQGDELEYPMSAGASGDRVALSSWFTGTVQLFDARTGKSLSMTHNIKTPHDAVPMPDGSFIVAEYAGGMITQRGGRFGELGRPVATGLVTPLGMAVSGNMAFVTEAVAGQVTRVNIDTGEKAVVARGLNMPEGIALMKDGTLVVAEVGARRLVAIGKDGVAREIAGNLPIGLPAPAGMPPTYTPTGVAVGGSDAIYVTSDADNSILKITKN